MEYMNLCILKQDLFLFFLLEHTTMEKYPQTPSSRQRSMPRAFSSGVTFKEAQHNHNQPATKLQRTDNETATNRQRNCKESIVPFRENGLAVGFRSMHDS